MNEVHEDQPVIYNAGHDGAQDEYGFIWREHGASAGHAHVYYWHTSGIRSERGYIAMTPLRLLRPDDSGRFTADDVAGARRRREAWESEQLERLDARRNRTDVP